MVFFILVLLNFVLTYWYDFKDKIKFILQNVSKNEESDEYISKNTSLTIICKLS